MPTHTPALRLATLLCLFLLPGIAFAQTCDPLALDDITDPGPYTVATLTEADGIRNGPDYQGATIYYPTNGVAPFSGMALVPGFTAQPSSIAAWGPFLASHGIATIIIGTNSPFDFPADRSEALLDAIVTLTAENTRAGSPLNGRIDTDNMAVGGWSMGGGGAQLAAVTDPTLKAVMALTPWLDPNNTTSADLDHPVPVVIFSGEADPTAPPASHADRHYAFTPDATDKLLFEVANGDHSVANGPAGANGEVGQLAISWLSQYLIGDPCYCGMRADEPATASAYESNVVCPTVTILPVTLQSLALERTKLADRINVSLTATDLARIELHGGYDQASTNVLGERSGAREVNETFTHLPADLGRPFYYRLRFIDYDDTFSWSEWLAASPVVTRARPQVLYGGGSAWLMVEEAGPTTAYIVDANGRRVATLALTLGRNRIPELHRGVYFIGFDSVSEGVRYFAN